MSNVTPRPDWADKNHKQPIDLDEKRRQQPYTKGLEFVKFGEFSREMLLWHSAEVGYFVTDARGRRIGSGVQLIPQSTAERLADAG